MLLATDPRQRTDVTFPAADDMPAESRPAFVYRYITVAEWFERRRLFAESEAAADDAATNAKLSAALMVGLEGWRNLATPAGEPVPFAREPGDLDRVLGYTEKLALYHRATDAVAIGADAKKNSASPRTSAPDSSAGGAPGPAAA